METPILPENHSEISRRITHYLLFNHEEDRKAFLKKIAKAKFRVDNESYYGSWEMPFFLQVSKPDTLDEQETIKKVVKSLSNHAQKLQGVYENWEIVED